MTTDDKSDAGSWEREIKARGLYQCHGCGWVGAQPSTTEEKDVVLRDGAPHVEYVHRLLCPSCFKLLGVRR